ncbi:MAG: aldo/keto reductase, partial [Acidimicrobiales bacterium]|nr:aldo/keto reductase [Acidimicrobiales bacterium]
METRRLGRTGHESTVAILGGAMFARTDPATTEAAFNLALDRGVNHLDIAPSYG